MSGLLPDHEDACAIERLYAAIEADRSSGSSSCRSWRGGLC